jgi:hypothetical protein
VQYVALGEQVEHSAAQPSHSFEVVLNISVGMMQEQFAPELNWFELSKQVVQSVGSTQVSQPAPQSRH